MIGCKNVVVVFDLLLINEKKQQCWHEDSIKSLEGKWQSPQLKIKFDPMEIENRLIKIFLGSSKEMLSYHDLFPSRL